MPLALLRINAQYWQVGSSVFDHELILSSGCTSGRMLVAYPVRSLSTDDSDMQNSAGGIVGTATQALLHVYQEMREGIENAGPPIQPKWDTILSTRPVKLATSYPPNVKPDSLGWILATTGFAA